GAFIARLPALRAIAFNGKVASAHGRRQIGAETALALIDLPSSSGANAMLSRDKKAEAWRILRQWV
ncbi:MAG TPA: DNA-deoxyinosine glycosylase, partial [Sphingobium sp.]|nr:DNA-deoxyinosine glycosylase [Sphingobium sp.]